MLLVVSHGLIPAQHRNLHSCSKSESGYPGEVITIEELYDAEGTIRDALDTVAGSWSIFLLIALRSGPLRYSQFKACLPDINDRMLSQTLQRFVRSGLVERCPLRPGAARHEYRLTPLGLQVSESLGSLAEVIVELAPQVTEARARFDAEQGEHEQPC